MDDDYYEQAAMRKQMKYKQKQLDNLLKIPISPAFDMTRYPASGMNVESFLSQYSGNINIFLITFFSLFLLILF